MTTPDIAALRKLIADASPGPWEVADDGLVWTTEPIPGDPVSGSTEVEDARLIAAACNALPHLLDEVERLRRRLRLAGWALIGVSLAWFALLTAAVMTR